MAFSLIGLAGFTAVAPAQSDPRPTYNGAVMIPSDPRPTYNGSAIPPSDTRPTYIPVYNAKISPWPSQTPGAAAPAAATGAVMPAVNTAPARTVYYKKEPNNWTVPASYQNVPPVTLPPANSDTLKPEEVDIFRLESETDMNKRINKDLIFNAIREKRLEGITDDKQRQKIVEELKRELTDKKLDELYAAQLEEDRRKADFNKTVPPVEKGKRKQISGSYFPIQSPISFPDDRVSRSYAQRAIEVEPNYTCYGRLFLEEKNTERYGWDLGPFTPLILTAQFFGDVTSMPYKVCSFPRLRYDCSAGQCMPGDPVPLMLYPIPLSATGGLAQLGTATALAFIFP